MCCSVYLRNGAHTVGDVCPPSVGFTSALPRLPQMDSLFLRILLLLRCDRSMYGRPLFYNGQRGRGWVGGRVGGQAVPAHLSEHTILMMMSNV